MSSDFDVTNSPSVGSLKPIELTVSEQFGDSSRNSRTRFFLTTGVKMRFFSAHARFTTVQQLTSESMAT